MQAANIQKNMIEQRESKRPILIEDDSDEESTSKRQRIHGPESRLLVLQAVIQKVWDDERHDLAEGSTSADSVPRSSPCQTSSHVIIKKDSYQDLTPLANEGSYSTESEAKPKKVDSLCTSRVKALLKSLPPGKPLLAPPILPKLGSGEKILRRAR